MCPAHSPAATGNTPSVLHQTSCLEQVKTSCWLRGAVWGWCGPMWPQAVPAQPVQVSMAAPMRDTRALPGRLGLCSWTALLRCRPPLGPLMPSRQPSLQTGENRAQGRDAGGGEGAGNEPHRFVGALGLSPSRCENGLRADRRDSLAAPCSALFSGLGSKAEWSQAQWEGVSNQPPRFYRGSVRLSPSCLVSPESRGGDWRLRKPPPSLPIQPWVPQTWVQILGSNQVPIPLLLNGGCTAVCSGPSGLVPRDPLSTEGGQPGTQSAPCPRGPFLAFRGNSRTAPSHPAPGTGEAGESCWPRSTLTGCLSPALPGLGRRFPGWLLAAGEAGSGSYGRVHMCECLCMCTYACIVYVYMCMLVCVC